MDELRLAGAYLETLYIVSTCASGCKGGDHLHEYLAGRCYNLGCAAFSLIRIGYYDEALSLIRSMGEIANLQSLFLTDSDEEIRWRESTKRERIRDFGPAAIRRKLENSGGLLLMDADTYSSLCEQATHVTPDTEPNSFTKDGHPRVGPHQQEEGAKRAISGLALMLGFLALGCSKFTGNDALFEEISQVFEATTDAESENPTAEQDGAD